MPPARIWEPLRTSLVSHAVICSGRRGTGRRPTAAVTVCFRAGGRSVSGSAVMSGGVAWSSARAVPGSFRLTVILAIPASQRTQPSQRLSLRKRPC